MKLTKQNNNEVITSFYQKLTKQNTIEVITLFNQICTRCEMEYNDALYIDFLDYANKRLTEVGGYNLAIQSDGIQTSGNISIDTMLTYEMCIAIVGGFKRQVLELTTDINYLFHGQLAVTMISNLHQT